MDWTVFDVFLKVMLLLTQPEEAYKKPMAHCLCYYWLFIVLQQPAASVREVHCCSRWSQRQKWYFSWGAEEPHENRMTETSILRFTLSQRLFSLPSAACRSCPAAACQHTAAEAPRCTTAQNSSRPRCLQKKMGKGGFCLCSAIQFSRPAVLDSKAWRLPFC